MSVGRLSRPSNAPAKKKEKKNDSKNLTSVHLHPGLEGRAKLLDGGLEVAGLLV